MITFFSRRCRVAIALSLIVVAGAAIGCGSDSAPAAVQLYGTGNTLAGRVTVNGKTPMPRGSVLIYNERHFVRPAASGPIESDGSYHVGNVPLGPIQIVIVSDESKIPALGTEIASDATDIAADPRAKRVPRGRPIVEPAKEVRTQPAVPAELRPLLDAVDAQYGSLTAPKKLTFVTAVGENQYDIDLVVNP